MKPEVFLSLRNKPFYHDLKAFLTASSPHSRFCYLRGRRRVGKSSLLISIQNELPLFYYSGKLDESSSVSLQRFANSWAQFSNDKLLDKIKKSELSWDFIFNQIYNFATHNKVIIALDEIQWLAKHQSGFIGALKNIWPKFESTTNIAIVICGSSNKFFDDFTGGEEQILRGLKTRADIWVNPFTLNDIKKHYFPKFKTEEILLIYMLTGGIPYYLNQFPKNTNFIQTINTAFFTHENIFIEEVDEVLRLEFNKAGVNTIKKILSVIGIRGRSYTEIEKLSKMPPGTLVEAIEKLVEYKILYEENSFGENRHVNKRGVRFKIQDFYLNTFFQILRPELLQIKKNQLNDLLVNKVFNWPKKFLYIENFTGEAFENLVKYILNNSLKRQEKIFQKLHLKNVQFEITSYFKKEQQIDLVIHETDDQQVRFIECKWTSSSELIKKAIIDLPIKIQNINHKGDYLMAVAIPIKATKSLEILAKKNNVLLIHGIDLS